MLFSSPSFLFGFLPIFILAYFLTPMKWRNSTILVGSLIFYFIDGGFFTGILCATIIFNYVAGICIYRSNENIKKWILLISIVINLLPLMFYKYWMFFLQSVNDISGLVNGNIHIKIPEVVLLAGVSFFTFHAISYLIDISRGKSMPERSLINFGMYMVNFPQLIAGPIVRYSEISDVIRNRPTSTDKVFYGSFTFIIGLTKKVVFADTAGSIADNIFSMPQTDLSMGLAWLGAIAYSLQIYFDFAGYSDMAIGLGRIMGFEFPENFNQPYRSKSITEFWRRWHMTLSRWFRDYVYIPLGGNQNGHSRTFLNLLIVFLLCGLWHGAAYTFIVWGLYHGALLVIERVLSSKIGFKPSGFGGQLITLTLVVLGWVIFRSTNLDGAFSYIGAMFGFADQPTRFASILTQLTLDKQVYLGIAIISALFPMEYLYGLKKYTTAITYCEGALAVSLLMLCTILIASNGFNPFIYFRF